MMNDPLQKLYGWARRNQHHPVLLGYYLYRVTSPAPGQLYLPLGGPRAEGPTAFIVVDYDPNRPGPLEATFHLLPYSIGWPRPAVPRVRFARLPALIHWLGSGDQRQRIGG